MSDQTSAVGGASGPGYAGDIDCKEAWDILQRDPSAVLVDLRTVPEWEFVGLPNLSSIGKQTALVQWQIYRGPAPNPEFLAELVGFERTEIDRARLVVHVLGVREVDDERSRRYANSVRRCRWCSRIRSAPSIPA